MDAFGTMQFTSDFQERDIVFGGDKKLKQIVDEIEQLCVELLKRGFRARYADHRLVASMIGNMAAYAALTQPGDAIMSVTQPFGGHSSNRQDGPAGVRGLRIHDVPMDQAELTVVFNVSR